VSKLSDLDHEILQKLLTETDKNGWNVLRYSSTFWNAEIDFFLETYKKIFDKKLFDRILTQNDYDSVAFLELMTKYLSVNSTIESLKHYQNEKYFNQFLCRYIPEKIINETSINKASLFELLVMIVKKCYWKSIHKAFQHILMDEELKTLLEVRDAKNQTLFDIAETGEDHWTVIKIKRGFTL
jgi:hypothetical protein